jgi:DNA-binding NarL/FixJ family response regulator
MSGSTEVPTDKDDLVTIVVVEDQDIVAEALSRALGGESGMDVVAVAGSVEAAVRSATQFHPRVIVMDYALPDGTGADAARRIKTDHPDIEIVMMTGLTGGGVLAEALEAGCSGFVPKQSHYSMLITAIRGVLDGQVQVPPDLMADLIAHLRQRPSAQGSELTVRELELLRLIAAGHSTSEIASELYLSVHTVRNHVARILTKLQAHTRLEAVVVAVRHGLIEFDAP